MRKHSLLLLFMSLGCSGRLGAAAESQNLDLRSRDAMSVEGGPNLELSAPPGDSEADGRAGDPTPGRKLTRRAWLGFRVDDEDEIPAKVGTLKRLVESHQGYLAHEHQSGATVRVPAAELDAFLEALIAGQGELLERRVEVLDVTRSYVDLESRLGSAKKTRARLEALLERAQDVEDVLSIEKELGRITAEVEAMEAQLRTLSQEVALATVEIQFRTESSPGPVGWLFYGVFQGVKWLFVWD